MKYLPIDQQFVQELGSEKLEPCVECGQIFDLFDVHLDGDGQFRCEMDSFGPAPECIAEANLQLSGYLTRRSGLKSGSDRMTR